MKILHLSTGGTITGCETSYPELAVLSHFFSDPVDIGKYFTSSMKIVADFEMRDICSKDSRAITEGDRKAMVQEIEGAHKEGVRHFLITHGTYTMPETGVYIINNLPEKTLSDISVVITGAMYPMNIVGSDALLNLGSSVSSLMNIHEPLGVVINMHARNWDPRKVEKDAENLIFKEIEE